MATAFPPSPQIATFLSSNFHSKPCSYKSLRIITTTLPSFPPIIFSSKQSNLFHHQLNRNNRIKPIHAATAEDAVPAAVDATEQLVSNADEGLSPVISALLFVAFIGLTAITIGVIYLGVTDFLQKREKEKFEKEEAVKGGKKKKKKVTRARAGPRGFGQKIDKDEEEEEND